MRSLICMQNVTKTYELGKVQVPALRDVTMEIKHGEFTTICGPSGSGKTTLLNLLGLIDAPTRGKIFLEGSEIGYNGLANLHLVRLEKLGFIFQTFNLKNAYNQKNIYHYIWDERARKTVTVHQWSILPVVGISAEF